MLALIARILILTPVALVLLVVMLLGFVRDILQPSAHGNSVVNDLPELNPLILDGSHTEESLG